MAIKLIVGLGNPGSQYDNTRHNVGFKVIDQLLDTLNLTLDETKFDGTFTKTNINGQTVILAKPLTFMNLSGNFVRSLCDFYKIWPQHILVVYDELAFDLGHLKLKAHGSGGGHNGMQNIISRMGTEKIKRIRIGIANKMIGDRAKFVLGQFRMDEVVTLQTIVANATTICYEFINSESFDQLMNKYNGK